ncbi:sulfatase-like hydrolase/transferase [Roseimaritima sediminicola]|uniref:sulfatase-like hydrolase/transferase n=1 Tax=Roseimaritima sediminicola TaxID=2662066 RepID=UPI00138756DA|nr:sulfatase-like hydrolase/transferase [Roseimaritima sediminicola]
MDMNPFRYKPAGFLVVLASLVCCTASLSAADVPKGVILVMIDDIGYGDIDGLYPSSLETPHLDKLYRQSVRLTDFHVGTTCAPTRASLMTGRSVNAGGVWHTIAGRELLREDEQTMAEVFQANGWRTGIFGKWHLGDGYPFSPRFRGFDTAVVHGGGGVGQGPDYWNNDYYSGVDYQGDPTDPDVYWENGETFEADKFCTDLWFERSQRFVKQSVSEGKPFFCYVPTNAAHGPFNAPHGYKEGFDGLIENVDDNMGRLDAFLTAEGLKDDVLLIFTTDNGTTGRRTGGLRGRKGSHYDGGHNVPCFVRWKNGGLGGSPDSARDVTPLTAAMDLLPTFMDMFDLQRPSGGHPLHGMSIKPLLLDSDAEPQGRTIVVDTQRTADLNKWSRACVMRDEVRDGKIVHKWRLIRSSAEADPELYDFQADRDTDDNLAEQYPEVVQSLSAAYDQWWDAISEDWQPYPPFVVDPEKESDLTLMSHSWIGANMSPWHQRAVKSAVQGTNTHSIRFDKPGRYQIELRRWPREDGGPLGGQSGSQEGKSLPIAQAELSIEGVGKQKQQVDPDATAATFEMDIQTQEPTKISSMFYDQQGEPLGGAYYVYIRPADVP